MFEVIKRWGLARIGKWSLEDQNAEVTTPNTLFIKTDRIEAPEKAEALISNHRFKTNKPLIIGKGSVFCPKRVEDENLINQDYVIPPFLIYPISLPHLDEIAIQFNKSKFESKSLVVAVVGKQIAEPVKGVNPELYVLANSLQLMRKPRTFIDTIVELRKNIGYQKLIYTPGLGSPNNLALLSYCGIDVFDSIPLIMNARQGYFLNAHGNVLKDEMKESACYCPACLLGNDSYKNILNHNYFSALAEIRTVRNAIQQGSLRDLVESRIRSEPWMVSVLRHLDKLYYDFQEKHYPIVGKTLIASSKESLSRPDVERFRRRIKERYRKPKSAKVLLLLPCSAKKPYSLSASHKRFRKAVEASGNKGLIHEVIVTSPLGIVPRELELFYPAQNYDIPVTRDWDRDEIAMVQGSIVAYLEINKYENVIVHLPEDYSFVEESLNNFMNTCKGPPTSNESLKSLENVLKDAVSGKDKIPRRTRQVEEFNNVARFQFGDPGSDLLEGCTIKGRYPNLRIMKGSSQIGMLVGQRGMISLTLEGAKILAKHHAYWVEMDDFELKGNLFAVGVNDADPNIRIGDDVVIVRKGDVVGVGVAQMDPDEMIESNRGEAVRVRHNVH